MAHELLSIKLSELDNQIARLRRRIQRSETTAPDRLHMEIQIRARAPAWEGESGQRCPCGGDGGIEREVCGMKNRSCFAHLAIALSKEGGQ